jgi:LPS O-antigen subunit length determinant protein (WzzB/FepE family)
MREIDKQDAQNSIDFLSESSRAVSIQSIKEVVSKLLESQMQTLMLASSSEAYVFKTIDSPIVPEAKSGPKRALICILGTALGAILSLLTVLVQHSRKPYTN